MLSEIAIPSTLESTSMSIRATSSRLSPSLRSRPRPRLHVSSRNGTIAKKSSDAMQFLTAFSIMAEPGHAPSHIMSPSDITTGPPSAATTPSTGSGMTSWVRRDEMLQEFVNRGLPKSLVVWYPVCRRLFADTTQIDTLSLMLARPPAQSREVRKRNASQGKAERFSVNASRQMDVELARGLSAVPLLYSLAHVSPLSLNPCRAARAAAAPASTPRRVPSPRPRSRAELDAAGSGAEAAGHVEEGVAADHEVVLVGAVALVRAHHRHLVPHLQQPRVLIPARSGPVSGAAARRAGAGLSMTGVQGLGRAGLTGSIGAAASDITKGSRWL